MKKKLIIGIVCAIAAIAAASAGIVFALNGNPKTKVINAAKKTVNDSGYLVEALSKFKYTSSEMTYSINAEYNDLGVEAEFSIDGNDKGVSAKITNDNETILAASALIDSKDVKVCFPGLDYDKQLIYRYTSDDKGDIKDLVGGSKQLEEIDSAIKALYDIKYGATNTEKLEKEIKKWGKNLESEKLDKKSFKVDGEKRDCKGYQIVITDDDIEDLADIVVDWMEDEYGDSFKDQLGGKSFDDLKKELTQTAKQIKKVKFNCYIYKNMLAAVVIESGDEKITVEFNGSDYRMQEIVAYTGKRSDENYLLKVSSKIKDKKETITFEIPGEYNLKVSYDKSNGKYEASVGQYSYWSSDFTDIASIKGTLEASSSKVTMKVSSITVKETPIELDKFVIELSNKASMPKIKGDEFRIDTADKDDLEDELKDLSSELSGALSNSSLLNTFKNLF